VSGSDCVVNCPFFISTKEMRVLPIFTTIAWCALWSRYTPSSLLLCRISASSSGRCIWSAGELRRRDRRMGFVDMILLAILHAPDVR